MVPKRLIKKLIKSASTEDLQVFAEECIKHIENYRSWDDSLILNALELIGGCANPYEEKHIDKDKLLDYIIKNGYKAENPINIKFEAIDNITLEVKCSYDSNDDKNSHYSITVPIKEISNVEDC